MHSSEKQQSYFLNTGRMKPMSMAELRQLRSYVIAQRIAEFTMLNKDASSDSELFN